jgi:hypothetical protein
MNERVSEERPSRGTGAHEDLAREKVEQLDELVDARPGRIELAEASGHLLLLEHQRGLEQALLTLELGVHAVAIHPEVLYEICSRRPVNSVRPEQFHRPLDQRRAVVRLNSAPAVLVLRSRYRLTSRDLQCI